MRAEITSTTSLRTDYHDNGVFVKKEYDTRSEKIYSQYDYKDDLLASRTEPNKQVYSYTYDANNDDMMSVSATVGSKTPKNEFEYSHGNLTKVMHNGYTYKFDYDGLNRNTSIIAGDTTLVSLAYTLGKTSTVKSTYGNGFTTVVTSDSRDNPINKTT